MNSTVAEAKIDGNRSKPGQNPGDYALSICGQFWLQVVEGNAFGNFDDDRDWKSGQKRSLEEVRRVFPGQEPSRPSVKFTGELSAGQAFEKPFGTGFFFRLEPKGFKIHDPVIFSPSREFRP